jgi:hypothetical protein
MGLNGRCVWFSHFNDASLITFKFWCVSCQTFSEILRKLRGLKICLRPIFIFSPWNVAKGVNTSWRCMNKSWTFTENHSQGKHEYWRTADKIVKTFSDILRISEKVWQETHRNLKQRSKIKGVSYKNIQTGKKNRHKNVMRHFFKRVKKKYFNNKISEKPLNNENKVSYSGFAYTQDFMSW